jgi:hypothetical protein
MIAQFFAARSAWVPYLAIFGRSQATGGQCQVKRPPSFYHCVLMVCLLLFTACGTAAPPPFPTPSQTPAGSCSLMLGADADDESAIRATLAAEGEQVVAQEITPLMALWAEDSFIADAKNTPDDDDDDQRWLDKDAIRHRYVRTVFPGAPASIQPADLAISIDGDLATVVATTSIGDEVAPAGDRWELVRQDGCWYIQSLTYNLEARE